MYQSCSTVDHTDSNNYSINHKLALCVLCENNATVPEQVSANRDC